MTKKTTVLLGTLLLFLVTVRFGLLDTGAILQVKVTKDTVNSIGNVEVNVIDTDPIAPILVNTPTSRNISIKNVGEANVFIRVLLFPLFTTETNLSEQLLMPELTTIADPNWQLGEDGYYYYLAKIKAKSSSAKLITGITIPTTKKAGNCELRVKVEAITTESNSYIEAWWQGVEPTETGLALVASTLKPLKD